MPDGDCAVGFSPWHNRDYLGRAHWWLLLQTGRRTRTVITQLKVHSSGAAEEQKFYIEKGMSFSNYLYEPTNLFHCLPTEPNTL